MENYSFTFLVLGLVCPATTNILTTTIATTQSTTTTSVSPVTKKIAVTSAEVRSRSTSKTASSAQSVTPPEKKTLPTKSSSGIVVKSTISSKSSDGNVETGSFTTTLIAIVVVIAVIVVLTIILLFLYIRKRNVKHCLQKNSARVEATADLPTPNNQNEIGIYETIGGNNHLQGMIENILYVPASNYPEETNIDTDEVETYNRLYSVKQTKKNHQNDIYCHIQLPQDKHVKENTEKQRVYSEIYVPGETINYEIPKQQESIKVNNTFRIQERVEKARKKSNQI